MTSQPDKLFRDHLEHFQKPAPSSAWERIESGMDHRHSKMLWIKIAASVIVLAAASILLWPKYEASSPSIVQKPDLPATENPITPTPSIQAPAVSAPVDNPNQFVISKSNSRSTVNQSTRESSSLEKDLTTIGLNPEPVTLSDTEPHDTEVELENAVQEVAAPSEKTQVDIVKLPTSTLTYSLDEMNSRFIKKTTPSEATSVAKNTSGIKKLMALASDLKHDESLYGDLRDKKNEILSFGLFDEKQGSER